MYIGKPNHQVPAYQYDIFISAFEKKVAEIQQQVNDWRDMERLYNLAVAWLKQVRIPEPHTIDFDNDTVTVRVTLTSKSWLDQFQELVQPLGQRLVELGLHEDGQPAITLDSCSTQRTLYWCVGNRLQRIHIQLNIPPITGTMDYEVVRTYRNFQYEHCTLVKRQET